MDRGRPYRVPASRSCSTVQEALDGLVESGDPCVDGVDRPGLWNIILQRRMWWLQDIGQWEGASGSVAGAADGAEGRPL